MFIFHSYVWLNRAVISQSAFCHQQWLINKPLNGRRFCPGLNDSEATGKRDTLSVSHAFIDCTIVFCLCLCQWLNISAAVCEFWKVRRINSQIIPSSSLTLQYSDVGIISWLSDGCSWACTTARKYLLLESEMIFFLVMIILIHSLTLITNMLETTFCSPNIIYMNI